MSNGDARGESADLDALLDFLRIPSVSTDPARAHDVRRAASWLCDQLAAAGFDADMIDTGGHPLVFAERIVDRSAPTVLIYGHYDVQPADPLEAWTSDPFEPVVRDGKIVARGASDDKGQVLAHVRAMHHLFSGSDAPRVNVKFAIEGEEEVGSEHLEDVIRANAQRLAADAVVVSDGAMLPGPIPTITYGLKGLVYLEVRLRTAHRDLHSGAYGGGVPNAAMALATLLATLEDAEGRIAVEGFYDDVREIDDVERERFDQVPFDPSTFASSIGVSATPGEPGRSLLERLWARPTLDVNGIGSGFQGDGSKTVIPCEAMAKVSCRLVPDQDPSVIGAALERHLRRHAPDGCEVEVVHHAGARWALASLDGRIVEAVAEAIRRVDGREPVFVRTGGTIPIVSVFQEVLGADVALVDLGLEDDQIHAPNERFSVELYHRGVRLSQEIVRAFAER